MLYLAPEDTVDILHFRLSHITEMASKSLFGKYRLSSNDWDKVSTLAKEAIKARKAVKRKQDILIKQL
ncbi:MAG: hypothetical protein FWH05_02055 [Oscillospiraceae bacterium]|nr:hypothetical protein [Oscillospiraceae bacterium]